MKSMSVPLKFPLEPEMVRDSGKAVPVPELPTHEDVAIAFQAEAECVAQLAIIRHLKLLDRDSRQRVMNAVHHLIEADRSVDGVLAKMEKP